MRLTIPQQATQEATSTSPRANQYSGYTTANSIATGGCGRITSRKTSRRGRACTKVSAVHFHTLHNQHMKTNTMLGGTNWMNPTGSARGKATDKQWLDVLVPAGKDGIPSNQLFSTTGGPLCYVYA